MKTFIIHTKHLFIKIFLVTVLSSISVYSFAQTDTLPPDPGAIVVYTVQDLSFGAFTIGSSGGTVVIASSGTRSVTGDVVALNLGTPYYQSIFDIDGPQGTIVSIINGSDATLTGSNGGSIKLHLGNSDPTSPFIITVMQPVRTPVHIGGTLTLGSPAANPPGTYTGTFYITFNQE